MSHDDFSPADFITTAEQAVAACAPLALGERASRLAADGLLGVIAPESAGGLGLPLPFAVPVMSAAGAGLIAFPLLETLLLARLLADTKPDLAASLVAGETIATIAWAGQARIEAGALSGLCGRAPFAGEASHVLVALEAGGAALLETGLPGVRIAETPALSLEQGECSIALEGIPLSSVTMVDKDAFGRSGNEALLLFAAAILGSAETSLAMAVTHVGDRRQFGKALVANQAIRHMLARQKLGLEGIRQSLNRALRAEAPGSLQARAAFVHAVNAGTAIAEGALQLHGGMGFTWDVGIHRHLRQIRAFGLRGDRMAALSAMAEALIGAA